MNDYDDYLDIEFGKEDEEMDVTKYRPGKPQCNEHLVRDLMNFSPRGALCQIFIMTAIQEYADKVAASTPEDDEYAFISPIAWHDVAVDIKAKLDKFYGRNG